MQFNFRKGRAVIALLIPVLAGFGPCGPIAGTQISGVEVSEEVKDFRFVQDVGNCALEVGGDDPHSVTVYCWPVGQQLFVGCMDCEGKTWSTVIDDNPVARMQIGEKVYRVKATKINDDFVVKRAWGYRWDKYEKGDAEPVPEGFWLYHMGSNPKG